MMLPELTISAELTLFHNWISQQFDSFKKILCNFVTSGKLQLQAAAARTMLEVYSLYLLNERSIELMFTVF